MGEHADIIAALIEITVESWRFSKNYEHLLDKLDAGERSRHLSQYRWFIQKIADSLTAAGMRIIDVSGQTYTAGIAATPININEFDPADTLEVSYMLEPIIMNENGVVRTGKVVLHKVEGNE